MRPKFLKTLTFSLIIAHTIGSISMLVVSVALAQTSHGIAMHGEMSLPSNYKKFSLPIAERLSEANSPEQKLVALTA